MKLASRRQGYCHAVEPPRSKPVEVKRQEQHGDWIAECPGRPVLVGHFSGGSGYGERGEGVVLTERYVQSKKKPPSNVCLPSATPFFSLCCPSSGTTPLHPTAPVLDDDS